MWQTVHKLHIMEISCGVFIQTEEISQKNMKRHLRYVHGVADKNTFTVKELKRPFKCDQCSKWSSSKDNLKAHIRKKHSDTTNEQFICNHCENTFIKNQHLNAHIRDKHSAILFNIKCNIFVITFNKEGNFKIHVKD